MENIVTKNLIKVYEVDELELLNKADLIGTVVKRTCAKNVETKVYSYSQLWNRKVTTFFSGRMLDNKYQAYEVFGAYHQNLFTEDYKIVPDTKEGQRLKSSCFVFKLNENNVEVKSPFTEEINAKLKLDKVPTFKTLKEFKTWYKTLISKLNNF